MAGLKQKILIALAAVVAIVAGLIVRQRHADRLAMYQGIHARAWAVNFYPNFDPSSTNITTIAFNAMGSNAVPTLRAMLKSHEPWYAKLFVQQGKQLPANARGYLTGKIKPGRSGMYRVAAARALGVVGTNATAAVPDLVVALGDNDMRWAAAQALASIGGPAIPALATATTGNDANIRHAAVYGLGQAGTNAWPATTALLDRVLDTNESVRASALYSLTQIGRSGMPMVLEAFSTDDPARRGASAEAIKAMNRPPRQILMTLLEFSTNTSSALRQNSLSALQTLHLNHPRVLAAYFEAMNDPAPGVRATAARALSQANTWTTNTTLNETTIRLLGRSGSLDSNALAALNGLLADPESSVRVAAQQTLASLQSTNAN